MALKCAEMATGVLAAGIADSDVALALSSGGSKFSTLGAGDYMYLRLCDRGLTRWEIVKCEAHAVGSNDFTSLTRNVRSSTGAAQAWNADDLVGQVFPGLAVEEILALIAAILPAASDAQALALATAEALLTPANLAAVIADHGGWPGFKNAIINGCMRIGQRAAASLVSGTYNFGVVDRILVKATGTVGAGTITQAADASLKSGKALRVSGVTLSGGSEALVFLTRIEAKDVARFVNQVASFKCKLKHNIGSAKNATVYIYKANAADNFSAVTEIGHSDAQSCASGSYSEVKLENLSMGDCSNGIAVQVVLDTGAITTKDIYIGEWQIEQGSVCTAFEVRPFSVELAMCQRYFDKSYELATAPGAVTLNGTEESTYRGSNRFYDQSGHRFEQRMRTFPTVTVYSPYTGARGKCSDASSDYTATTQNICERGFFIICGYPTANTEIYWHWVAEAEL